MKFETRESLADKFSDFARNQLERAPLMGSPWCASLPVVHVPQTAERKDVTLVLPYYENPRFLRQQMGWWSTYPRHLRDRMSVVIVDDGSRVTPASSVLYDYVLPISWLRVFRIDVDIRWNWLAARNIGAHESADGWLLLTDMDHVMPQSTFDALVHGQHDESVIYGFSRIEHTGEVLTPHPNSWFMTRTMFWKVGGYDEALSGHYGTDGDWRRRCAATAPMQILENRLVRHEHQGDSSTVAYLRKQPEDAGVRQIIAARRHGWRPKVLSFPYYEELAVLA